MPGNSEVGKLIMSIRISLVFGFHQALLVLHLKGVLATAHLCNVGRLSFCFHPITTTMTGNKISEANNWRFSSTTDEKVLPTCLGTFNQDQQMQKVIQSSNVHYLSSVISAVDTLFSCGELTFYLAKYSYGCCCHWLAVAHINCPWAEECLPEGQILSQHQIISSLIAAGFIPSTHPVESRTMWSLIGLHVPTDVNLGHATGSAKMTPTCILFLFLNKKLKLLQKKRLLQELADRTINLLAQLLMNSAWI